MKNKIKKKKSNQRKWYAVFCMGSCNVDYFISACSKHAVEKYMMKFDVKYKVILARSWTLVQAFSGTPSNLSAVDISAANEWGMEYTYTTADGVFANVVHVAILD